MSGPISFIILKQKRENEHDGKYSCFWLPVIHLYCIMYFILKGVVRGNEGKVASSSLGYHTPGRVDLQERVWEKFQMLTFFVKQHDFEQEDLTVISLYS